MKRFGYYVRLGGDREISEALARGDAGALMPAPGTRSEAVRRVAMWQHTPQEWDRMIRRARKKYRHNKPVEGVRGTLLVGYAMVCYGVQVAFDWLWDAIERRKGT